jgi:uncharacterized phage-associated protein
VYSPLTIANTLIKLKPGQNAMWLNKMVHVVHGWSLAFERSVVGELPQVWQHGPIYASLYDDLRAFRHEPISKVQPAANSRTCPTVPDTDLETLRLIEKVLDQYGHFDHLQLSSLCHAARSPWALEAASKGHRFRPGHAIPEWRIQNHYRNLLAAHNSKAAA